VAVDDDATFANMIGDRLDGGDIVSDERIC